jgi:hypothetical protein
VERAVAATETAPASFFAPDPAVAAALRAAAARDTEAAVR